MMFAPLLLAAAVAAATPAPPRPVTIDLTRPFATRTPWRFTAIQAPPMLDPIVGDGMVPGAIRLCLRPASGACLPALSRLLTPPGGTDLYAEPHELGTARIVRPRGQAPLLLLRVASLHSVDGDQRVATMLLAYDRPHDRVLPVFTQRTGRNNDQEVRYIDTGPLAGRVIAAEPTSNAPFAYWITVSAPAGTRMYRRTLRYRSTTRYGDGDSRAVIDAEMPTIVRRLRPH